MFLEIISSFFHMIASFGEYFTYPLSFMYHDLNINMIASFMIIATVYVYVFYMITFKVFKIPCIYTPGRSTFITMLVLFVIYGILEIAIHTSAQVNYEFFIQNVYMFASATIIVSTIGLLSMVVMQGYFMNLFFGRNG